MFSVDQVIDEYYPALNNRRIFAPLVKTVLRRLLHEQAFLDFAEQYPHLRGIEFVKQVLEYFHFSYIVSDRQRENIPSTGKIVIIANHPIGSLDGLALLKLIYEVRPDAKIVANDLLMSIPPLRPCLLPVRNMTGQSGKRHIQGINSALENEETVIIFPSGEVSRFGLRGIKDGVWHQGFLKMAERAKAPILPIHISGRNSITFYITSILLKSFSTIMLVSEMFNQRKKQVHIRIGSIIPYETYRSIAIRRKDKIQLFKKHVYRIGSKKSPLFATDASIARPERRADLVQSVSSGEKLGNTPDGKTIYLFEPVELSPIMREIGRLREITFRAVGEGTGKRRDLDHFDRYYQHLILWDNEDLEIAGAYRFVDAGKVVADKGPSGLYSGSLFKLDQNRCYFLENGLELGRSFVQQRYWKKRSLDYLWYGIGAFLVKNPQYRYLFGPVSISNTMSQMAKELLIYFYKLYFSADKEMSCSRNPFSFSQPITYLKEQFSEDNYHADFRKLKSLLSNLGTAVPPLYRQYTELCEPGGVIFLDFNIDPAFNNCIDGLVIVDTHKLKEQKRKRYMEQSILV
ncbi:MAG: lysophospholipid acyltransferase family protein [Deltaproteobacteria bacterium]|nr:lysophospholipid acyltransferase family protein [Deltaproteobacteria bacterium]